MGLVTPEAELLLLLARQDLDDAQLARAAELTRRAPPAVDWARFIGLAVQHRVGSLVGSHSRQLLERGRKPDIGTSAITLLHDAYLAGISRSGSIKCELTRILRACTGLRVAVRKGGHLAFHMYREPALRPMADFDLLVTRETAPSVVAALNDLGYGEGQLATDGRIRPFTRRQRVFWQLHGSDLPKLSRRGDGPFIRAFSVDINVELVLPGKGLQVPVSEFLDRAVQSSIGDSPCLLLAPEDTVIDLSLSLYKNSTVLRYMAFGKHRRLLKYVDIAEFLGQSHIGFSWEILMARVGDLGITEPMYFALAHLEMLFPASVPHDVLDDLRRRIAEPAKLLQAYGQWDFPEPQSWRAPFLQWFFDCSAEADLSPSRSLV
jgi:hypothetical protein